MASRKRKAKHSRQERLKQIAQQIENGESLEGEEGASVESSDAAAVEPTAEIVDGSADETVALEPAGSADATVAIGPAATADATVAINAVDPADATVANTIVIPEVTSGDEAEDKMAGFDIDAAGYPLDGALAEDGAFLSPDFAEMPKRRKRRALKALGITIGVLAVCVIAAYIAGAVFFMHRFLPNTFIGDYDISMKTDEEVIEMLDSSISSYKLDVVGNGFTYQTTSEDIGLSIDSESIVSAMHNDLDSWTWPLLIVEPEHDESRHLVTTYKRDESEKAVAKRIKKFNKDAKAPVDATIVFNEKTGQFEVKKEEEGTKLDADAVKAAVSEAISNMQPTLTLGTDQLAKPKVYSTDEKLIESAKLATGMVSAHVILNLDGKNVKEISGDALSEFVTINDKLDVSFNEDGVNDWVTELANGFDTIGTERHYTRDDGKEITVKGGSYGWEVDTEATKEAVLDAIKNGKQTEIDIPCISTANAYTGPGERDWGNRYLDVDISEQHVRFFGDNGKIIWETDFISGAPDGKRNTWEGVWYINNKESPSTLIGYTDTGKKEYETKVTYWMPFEGNGIGFHDAPWQPGFGGTMYQDGYGSHGCVNLSSEDAKELYGIVQIGDVVVVHS